AARRLDGDTEDEIGQRLRRPRADLEDRRLARLQVVALLSSRSQQADADDLRLARAPAQRLPLSPFRARRLALLPGVLLPLLLGHVLSVGVDHPARRADEALPALVE